MLFNQANGKTRHHFATFKFSVGWKSEAHSANFAVAKKMSENTIAIPYGSVLRVSLLMFRRQE
jgi:hypothetical protein